MAHKNKKFIQAKIRKIMHEGIKGKKVGMKQAAAVAFSIGRRMHKR